MTRRGGGSQKKNARKHSVSDFSFLVLPFLCFCGKRQGKTPKTTRIFVRTEPPKSFSERKKGNAQKGQETIVGKKTRGNARKQVKEGQGGVGPC